MKTKAIDLESVLSLSGASVFVDLTPSTRYPEEDIKTQQQVDSKVGVYKHLQMTLKLIKEVQRVSVASLP